MAKIERLDMKKLMKDRETNKNFFRSRGVSTIKKTELDENEKPIEKLYEIEIYPFGEHPALKEYLDKNKEVDPPTIRRLINKENGKEWTEEGITPEEAEASSKYIWANIYDYTDKKYQEASKKRESDVRLLMMMICFDMVDEFGVDKIKEFEEAMTDLGFTANQFNKIGEDIKALDFLPSKK